MSQASDNNSYESTFNTLPRAPLAMGKYEILEEVGCGSMGTVYAAYDPFADRTVAIKIANSRVDGKEDHFRKLFFNEVHAAGVLDHPNIISLYDANVDADQCFLVMEFVPGAQTLQSFCKADSLLSLKEVVSIVFKCAKALDYAHRQGIIHRDIKPSNILFTRDRDVRLSDFSIARITRPDRKPTRIEGFVGSPMYMSPEQINKRGVEANSDLFSLGVVMYELLTGSQPFRADSLGAITHKITNEDPLPLAEYRTDIPDGLDYILGHMLEKESSRRYATGLDLAADIALIFDDLEKLESEESLRGKFDTLQKLGFFRGFNDAEIWGLMRAGNWLSYSPGQTIIREGDTDNSFYILLSGVVTVEKHGRIVDSLKEGDCFGETGFLSETEIRASVIAKTDASILQLNAATLERADQTTQIRFLKVFAKILVQRQTRAASSPPQQ